MPSRYRNRYDSWNDREEYYRWRREQEEYDESEEWNNYYDNVDDEYYAQGAHVACQCEICHPPSQIELPVSTDGTEPPVDKQLIKRLLDMVKNTTLPTKLSYIEKLFQYLVSVPSFMNSNEHFQTVALNKAKEIRADIKTQPIYEILDKFIATYDK